MHSGVAIRIGNSENVVPGSDGSKGRRGRVPERRRANFALFGRVSLTSRAFPRKRTDVAVHFSRGKRRDGKGRRERARERERERREAKCKRQVSGNENEGWEFRCTTGNYAIRITATVQVAREGRFGIVLLIKPRHSERVTSHEKRALRWRHARVFAIRHSIYPWLSSIFCCHYSVSSSPGSYSLAQRLRASLHSSMYMR